MSQTAFYQAKKVLMIRLAPLPKWFLVLFAPALMITQVMDDQVKDALAEQQIAFDFILVPEEGSEELSELLAYIQSEYAQIPIVLTSDESISQPAPRTFDLVQIGLKSLDPKQSQSG